MSFVCHTRMRQNFICNLTTQIQCVFKIAMFISRTFSCDCTYWRMSEIKWAGLGKLLLLMAKKINWITWPNVISDILIRTQSPPSFSVWEINLVPRAFPGKALGTSCVRTLPLSQAYSERKTMINVLLVLMKLWTTLRTFSTSESALSPPVLPWRCQSRDSSDCKL